MFKPLRAIVYDLDGTILDSLPQHHAAIQGVCELCGKNAPPLATMCEWWYAPYDERFRAIGVTLPPEKLWPLYYQKLGDGSSPLFPEVISTLAGLRRRQMPVYLATACGQMKRIYNSLCAHRLLGYFTDFYFGQDDKTAFIAEIINQTGLDPRDIGFVCDMKGDVENGKAAGVRVIGFDGGYGGQPTLFQAGAEDVIETHPEIFRLIDYLD